MQLKDSSNYMHPEEQDYENAPSNQHSSSKTPPRQTQLP